MKLSLSLIVFIKLFMFLSTGAQPVPDRKFEPAALVRDLALIRTSVEAMHPGLGRFGPKEEFLSALDSIKSVVEQGGPLALVDFFRMVNPVLVRLRCGHTKFFPPMQGFPFYFHTDHVLPCIVRFDDTGRLLVIRASQPELAGKYLESINGRPVTSIVNALRAQMFADGHVKSSADAQIEQYFSAWYADFIQDQPEFTLGLEGADKPVSVKGITSKEWQDLNKNSSYLSFQNRLQFLNDSVASLRVATFYSEEGNKDFVRFLDSSFTEISKRKISHLVIDVRGNEGGNDRLGKELYARIALKDFRYYDRIEVKVRRKRDVPARDRAYLPKFLGLARFFIKKDPQGRLLFTRHRNLGEHHPDKKAFKGKVWFLLDGLSYSVTSEFLAVARSEERGVFAGQESGGAYEGDNSGTFAIYKLPETGLDLGIPLGGYYSAVKTGAGAGRGIMPDVECMPSKSDLLAGDDPVLRSVRQRIAESH
nr:S41 family peptidase [uncultured Dyadobacter sp.]